MSIRTAVGLCIALLVCGLVPSSASAADGGCDEQFFQTGFFLEDGKRVFEDKFQAFSIRMGTPAYKAATGADRMPKTIGFDQKLRVTDPGEGTQRIRVKKLSSDEDVGWVERDDLLCRLLPLTDSHSGLLRRVVIQTETAERGKVEARLAYESPLGQCEGGNSKCPKLSRFQWYFIYAEESGHLLLSEAANLGGRDARLVGWLPEKDGIKWNTAVALRPAEELERRKLPNGSEAQVCAFPTLAAIKDPKQCRPLLGGKRWFKIETRLPILQDLGDVYEVAISSAATSGTFEEALSLAGADALRNLDVFFVVDGTKSMRDVIETIKGRPGFPGVVDQIRARMKGKISEGGTLRYGYRIYRDSVKGGKTGVEDDGLPLTGRCGANEDEFVKSFQAVRAEDPDVDNDYPENSFAGLIQAGKDFSTCPDHLKLVVVIGDHGYDPDAQRRRGHKAYDVEQVVQRYVRGRSDGVARIGTGRLNTQPVIVFIQTPNEVATANNPAAYQKAYDAFYEQGIAILKRVYGSMQAEGVGTAIKPEDYFFRLPSRQADSAFINGIINRVDDLLHPDVVGKLVTRLNSGEALMDAIRAMQGADRTNVPILYWQVVADALCKRLGSQCTKQVLEGVFKAYIPHSKDLTHDVLLSRQQLEDWHQILAKFQTFWSQLRSGESSRRYLVNTLMQSIGSVLKLVIDDSGKSIGEFLRGLPHGAQSKLMAYTPDELRREDLTKQCEIQHLVNYASKKADIIQILLDGDKLPEFKEGPLPPSACPTLTAKGQAVPHLAGAPTPRALNPPDANTDYNFSFRKGNDRYYWIRVDYLP